ncbi:response regulator [Fibrobacterota bacterium]
MADEKILIVEDEEDIQELIRYNLDREGYAVSTAQSGEEAMELIKEQKPDLILLDLMLPGIDGLELCRRLKEDQSFKTIPIIMVTAKGEESDIIRGLELGADDYIAKPFSTRILSARVKTVLRRAHAEVPSEKDVIERNGINIHPGRHEVVAGGENIDLTSSEFKALHLLGRRPGWVYTRTQLVEEIHGDDYPVTSRSVDVLMVGLRKKLGAFGEQVETVRGVGYRFRE